MKTSTITSLASLATATAAYESAWRAEIGLALGSDERKATSAAMRDAYHAQVAAQSAVASELGDEAARAITGALIQSTAHTSGVRPERHAVINDPASFIRDCINEQAGV